MSKRYFFANRKVAAKERAKVGFKDIISKAPAEEGVAIDDAEILGKLEDDEFTPEGVGRSRGDIYREIGMMLQEARNKKGVKLEEIAEFSKIRVEYLQMIEDGLYKEVSRLTYYPGCVSIMARMSGLDQGDVLLQLASCDPHLETVINSTRGSTQGDEKVNANQKALAARKRDAIRRDMIILFGIIVGLLVVVGWMKSDNTAEVGDKFLQEVETATKK